MASPTMCPSAPAAGRHDQYWTPAGVALSGRFDYLTDSDVIGLEVACLGKQRQRLRNAPTRKRQSSLLACPPRRFPTRSENVAASGDSAKPSVTPGRFRSMKKAMWCQNVSNDVARSACASRVHLDRAEYHVVRSWTACRVPRDPVRHERQLPSRTAPRTSPFRRLAARRSPTNGSSRSQPRVMILWFVCRNLGSTFEGGSNRSIDEAVRAGLIEDRLSRVSAVRSAGGLLDAVGGDTRTAFWQLS